MIRFPEFSSSHVNSYRRPLVAALSVIFRVGISIVLIHSEPRGNCIMSDHSALEQQYGLHHDHSLRPMAIPIIYKITNT